MCLLQDDIVKFVSEPASPPLLVEIPEEGKGKAKEHREVGEGDDTVIVEDTSDEDDEETLQERFQLRSRFSRPGLPNVPLIQDPPTGLEASSPVPPRKPRNVARKHVAKKLKVFETTSQEVNSLSRVVEYFVFQCCVCLTTKFCCLHEIPPSSPVDQGDEGDWETVGEPAERSCSPAPTVEELVSQLTHQSTMVVEPQAPVVEDRTEPAATPAAEEPAATEAEEEAPAQAGLVDIASILGAPTVTVVWSTL
jgi:hypothetical protein